MSKSPAFQSQLSDYSPLPHLVNFAGIGGKINMSICGLTQLSGDNKHQNISNHRGDILKKQTIECGKLSPIFKRNMTFSHIRKAGNTISTHKAENTALNTKIHNSRLLGHRSLVSRLAVIILPLIFSNPTPPSQALPTQDYNNSILDFHFVFASRQKRWVLMRCCCDKDSLYRRR